MFVEKNKMAIHIRTVEWKCITFYNVAESLLYTEVTRRANIGRGE